MALDPFILLWMAAIGAHIWFSTLAYRRRTSIALVLSSIAVLVSGLALAFIIRVFYIGGASNVAQMSVGAMRLWSLWLHAYFPLLVGCGIALLTSFITVALPPYPPREWHSFMARLSALASASLAGSVVLLLPPDA